MILKNIKHNDFIYVTGTFNEFADFIVDKIKDPRTDKVIIVHLNLRNYYYLHKDKHLINCIKKNCLVVFDGIGMKTGFFLKGVGLLPDLNGTDLFPLVMKQLCFLHTNIFFLGSDEKSIELAAKNCQTTYPGINICGYHHGYFPVNSEEEIVTQINQSNADILMIGRGFPLQEQFAIRNKDKLNVSLLWNVGGLFDFISGNKKRAPYMVRKIRLEWLFRFMKEPCRMLHRNTVAAFWSLGHILFSKK